MSTWISPFPKFSFSKLNHGNSMNSKALFFWSYLDYWIILTGLSSSAFIIFLSILHSAASTLYIQRTHLIRSPPITPITFGIKPRLLDMGSKDPKTKPLFNCIFALHSPGSFPPQSQCWKQHSTIILPVSQSSHTFSWVWPSYCVSTYYSFIGLLDRLRNRYKVLITVLFFCFSRKTNAIHLLKNKKKQDSIFYVYLKLCLDVFKMILTCLFFKTSF